jgi:hypothetical protein
LFVLSLGEVGSSRVAKAFPTLKSNLIIWLSYVVGSGHNPASAGRGHDASPPKNKKSASRIEALFPSGGKLLPSLIRAHLRQGRFDIYTTTVLIEAYNTVYEGEDCVIPTKPNILSRQKLRTALANNNISGNDQLATELLHAQAFANAVASVLNAALTFLMCHTLKKLEVDRSNLNASQLAPMAHRPMITFPAPILECDHLFILKLLHDFPGNFRPIDQRSTQRYIITITMKHNFSECDLVAGVTGKLFDSHRFAGANPILFVP